MDRPQGDHQTVLDHDSQRSLSTPDVDPTALHERLEGRRLYGAEGVQKPILGLPRARASNWAMTPGWKPPPAAGRVRVHNLSAPSVMLGDAWRSMKRSPVARATGASRCSWPNQSSLARSPRHPAGAAEPGPRQLH